MTKELEKDLDSFFEAEEAAPEPKPTPEPAPKPEPEPEPTPAPEPEPESESKPMSEPESESEPEPESEPEDELTSLKKQNELLLQRLEELASGKPAASSPVTTPPKEKEEPKEDDDIKFINEDTQLDDLLDDRNKLNKLLNVVYKRGLEASRGLLPTIEEKILRGLPRTIMAQVQQQAYMQAAVDNLFKEYPALNPVRKTVGAIATEVAAEHADWPLDKVFTEAAERAHKVLGIKKEVIRREEGKTKNPAFIDASSGRNKESDTRTSMQKEIDELLTD
jgi:hypothetical protein